MALPRWVEPYIGVPFVESGFALAGCHCWGLVCLVFQRERGIELPRHAQISAKEIRAIARAIDAEAQQGPWRVVEGPRQAFDVALLWSRRSGEGESVRLPQHVGVMVGPDHLLHVERASATVAVPIDHSSVRHRFVRAYRHHSLT